MHSPAWFRSLPLHGLLASALMLLAPTVHAQSACSGSACGPDAPSIVQAGTGPIIDVLDYMLPPNGTTRSPATLTADNRTWRTFADSAIVTGEALPGFFITRGAVDATNTAWGFEHFLYDDVWVYALRDASWSERCLDNNLTAGRLTFRMIGDQFVRGSALVPRLVASGSEISTGNYYVQGVERRVPANAHVPGEGRYCDVPSTGWKKSRVRVEWLSYADVAGTVIPDVVRLTFVGGYRNGEKLLFARGKGLIKTLRDGVVVDRYQSTLPDSDMKVRLPCMPELICF